MRHSSIIAASSLLLASLVFAAASRADVVVEPATPSSGQPVAVRLLPTGGEPLCLIWSLRTRESFTITLVGAPPPPAFFCPQEGPAIQLGTLAPGRYHVEARRQDGTMWGEVFFTVVSAPLGLFTNEALLRPARPTTSDAIDVVLSLSESPPCFGLQGIHDVAIAGDAVTIDMNVYYLPFECWPTPVLQHGFVVHLPPLTAGLKTLTVSYEGSTALQRHFTVEAASATVRLGERFDVQLTWTDPGGVQHSARPERLSDASAVFSFSDPANAELTVKALDGRPVNGKFWIFAASLTDQPWELHVVDRASQGCGDGYCAERVYKGVAHKNANVLDTQAFTP